MAVVRITQALRDQVVMQAKRIFDNKINAIQNMGLPDGWTADKIYDTAMAPWQQQIDALPECMFHRTTYIGVTDIGGVRPNLTRFELSAPRVVPQRFPKGHCVENMRHLDPAWWVLPNKEDSPFAELIAVYKERDAAIQQLVSKRDEFVQGVQKVLTANTTLAPALRMWPPLWDLLPDNAKEAHKRVVDKKPSEKQAEELDVSSLTATLVATKMGL